MTLDEVRELKKKVKADLESKKAALANLEGMESRLETTMDSQEAERREAVVAYFDRLIALLNDLIDSQEVRVAFRKEGEKKWTNILPSCKAAQNAIRDMGTMLILGRLSRRATEENVMIVLEEEVGKCPAQSKD